MNVASGSQNVLRVQFIVDSVSVMFGSESRHCIWRDPQAFPAYFAVLSAVVLAIYGFVYSPIVQRLLTRLRSRKSEEEESDDEELIVEPSTSPHAGIIGDIKTHISSIGGPVIFAYKFLRLVSCVVLLGLTITTLIVDEWDRETSFLNALKKKSKEKKGASSDAAAFTKAEWLQVALALTYTYASFLALVSVTVSHKWAKVANTHLVLLLLSIFGVFAYRNVWPLATYTLEPADLAEGWLMWTKLAVLTAAAVFIPLCIPRPYIPVDPKDPAPEPNPEQTTPLISLLTYTFLDKLIFKANRVPHLAADEFPPLADYDYAKNLVKRSFKHLDPFQGAKKQHIFFSLMAVFYREYVGIFVMVILRVLSLYAGPVGIFKLLEYLESEGRGATIRPWVWISWLFLSPVADGIAFQWYIFLTTGTLVRTEGIITELIFEHALRIRMKAEVPPGEKTSSGESTVVPTPDTASVVESEGQTEGASSHGDNASPSGSSDEATLAGSQAGTLTGKSKASKGKGKDADAASTKSETTGKPKPQPTSRNLVGKLNNLVTTDLSNITSGRDFVMLCVQCPLMIAFGVLFLYNILGWSAFMGMLVMVICFPLPGYVATIIRKIQQERMKKTDARVQTVTETMNVVRMVKLFGWEPNMKERIGEKRDEELVYTKKRQIMERVNGVINFIIPLLTMIATFAVYTLVMKEPLSASRVFSSMAVFDLLREQLQRIFWFVPSMIQAKVSLDRVQEFLNSTELLDEFQDVSKGEVTAADIAPGPQDPDVIGFCDATFAWSNEVEKSATPSRRNFRLNLEGEIKFKRDAINLIIGPTGSGKTSLLMALLSEMHFIPSTPSSWYNLPRDKGIAYAAQESWVQNETIRDNIIFGAPFDEARYKKVIYQCALERDLQLFDAGDQTEVGEKGLTLSGGQKARVTLARAVYSQAEILLLDDVLAALDVHTSRWIVEKCFKGDLIKGRTVILVTHNVAMASPIAGFVLSLGSDGRVATQGTVEEVIAKDKEMQVEVAKSQEENLKEEEVIDLAAEAAPKKSDGKLVVAEEIALGHVSWSAFKLYLFNLGGLLFWVFFMGGLILQDLGDIVQVWFLGYWASQYDTHPSDEVYVPFYLSVYTGILAVGIGMYTLAYILYVTGVVNASRVIHKRLIESIMGSTLRWLDSTPTGRIIARCTQDITAVDGAIPGNLNGVLEITIALIQRVVAIVYVTPLFVIPSFVVGAVGAWCGQLYMKAQLSVKRESSNAKSPVLNHFGAAITGLVSIRAYGAQEAFKSESLLRIDRYVRASRTFYNLNRWVSMRVDTLTGMFAAALAAYLVYGRDTKPNNLGFSLNMAMTFSSLILWWIRILNEFEVQGNSLERIQGYIEIEQETKSSADGVPPAYWPSSGNIRVENLCARYSHDGPEVLHNISFELKSGERVGVVGRTGSGKSSLTLSLLRCIVTEGTVYYDGLPTNKINLDALRRNITIIPQVPELISGTLRQNLDIFDEHDDATLNDALRAAGLFSLQKEDDEGRITLDTAIAAGGSNLSVGQRQILALARAIVRGSKLLILDEATSAIDYDTDSIIQSSLRNELKSDMTLLTIAHRLQTIMDSDRIMVLDAGKLVEFDTPKNLLQKEGGYLKSLVDESGDKDVLYSMALDSKKQQESSS